MHMRHCLARFADAGADLATFRHPSTQYSLVQTAANAGKLEAVMALVSAGAPWRLGPDEPRRIGDSLFYVPDILAVTAPHIKVRHCTHQSTRHCIQGVLPSCVVGAGELRSCLVMLAVDTDADADGSRLLSGLLTGKHCRGPAEAG